MGLTERHWFENEDVPENYEWALEDAVYNSRTNKKLMLIRSKLFGVRIAGCMMNEFLCAAIVGYHENKHFSVQTGKGDDVGMNNMEKVIYSIERCICHVPDACRDCGYDNEPCPKCFEHLLRDAHDLLKAQELPDVKPEKLEERTTKWLDQMTAEERLEEIAAILDDWDGYRTAKGLGGLINEVWAYALYPVKAQEPRVMTREELFALPIDTPVFIEESNGECGWNVFYGIDEENDVCFCGFKASADYYSLEEYGESWRCWTSRPSDSERKNTPWEN